MLLDVVTTEQVRELRAKLLAAVEKAGRTQPSTRSRRPTLR
ncbi:hypothetical protein [Streptomyces sp. NRRL S-646]|nr:hypothetical protein [Streptomyces sp. NRRL S-646]